jgi:SAM-dependent methyltransferase
LTARPVGDARSGAWDASYDRLENHLYWPSEEIVRFMSRFVRRRVAPHEYVDVMRFPDDTGAPPRILDLGCGVGRHMVFAHELRLDPFGIDLSRSAIEKARAWLAELSPGLAEQAVVGDVRALPWRDGFFSVVVSHGVLDSMPFEMAMAAAHEVKRVLAPRGYFYCDLVASDSRSGEKACELEVTEGFEAGTVQSYFDQVKIERLLGGQFEFVDQTLVTTKALMGGHTVARWHLVLRATADVPVYSAR